MKVHGVDASPQRAVLIGMIVSDAVAGRIASRWEEGGLFPSRLGNALGGLVADYFNRYGRAPGRNVETLARSWADGKDEATADEVEQFLRGLDYDAEIKSCNADWLIDRAADYFSQVKIQKLTDAVNACLLKGQTKKAQQLIEGHMPVEMGAGGKLDLLNDDEAVRRIYEQDRESLIRYDGDLGKFFGRSFKRESLVALMGAAKRGKCVSGDTLVLRADGSLKAIREIVRDKDATMVMAYNERAMTFVPVRPEQFHENGVRQCYKVRTKSGKFVEATANHPLLTPDGWKRLDEVRVGDFIASAKTVPDLGRVRMREDELIYLAMMLADGGCTATNSVFTKADAELNRTFQTCCDRLGFPWRAKGMATRVRRTRWLRDKYPGALLNVGSKTKAIPAAVFRCPDEQIALFLRHFYSCDGWMEVKERRIGLTLANEKMLRQISHLLVRLGIVHAFYETPKKCQGKTFAAWTIMINSAEAFDAFATKVNMLSYKRVPTVAGGVSNCRSYIDRFPHQIAAEMVRRYKQAGGKAALDHVRYKISKSKPLTRAGMREVMAVEQCRVYYDAEAMWDEVKEITAAGSKDTYDIGVPGHHNFVGDGIVLHNSWALMDMVYRSVVAGHKTAYFIAGDLTQDEVTERFMTRLAERPVILDKGEKIKEWKVPTNIDVDKGRVLIDYDEFEVKRSLPREKVLDLRDRFRDGLNAKDLLAVSIHPTSTLSVPDMRAILHRWEREGWGTPAVVVIDYSDILANPTKGASDSRDQVNATWKGLARMRQELHCCVVTATQADADSYDADLLKRSNFTDDRRKHDHVTGMIGLNQTPAEKERGVYRLNWLDRRGEPYSERDICFVAGCLDIADPFMVSFYKGTK